MCLRRESPRESPRSGMPPASKAPAIPFDLACYDVENRSLNIYELDSAPLPVLEPPTLSVPSAAVAACLVLAAPLAEPTLPRLPSAPFSAVILLVEI